MRRGALLLLGVEAQAGQCEWALVLARDLAHTLWRELKRLAPTSETRREAESPGCPPFSLQG